MLIQEQTYPVQLVKGVDLKVGEVAVVQDANCQYNGEYIIRLSDGSCASLNSGHVWTFFDRFVRKLPKDTKLSITI